MILQHEMMNLILNRCYSERILLSMGQSPELARKTHEYILLFIPNIFSVFTIVALRKFLQGLGNVQVHPDKVLTNDTVFSFSYR